MDKCDNCGKEIKLRVYFWEGYTMRYCSATCSAYDCPSANLKRTVKEN